MICLCFSNPLHLSLSCVTLFNFTVGVPAFVHFFSVYNIVMKLYSTEITFYHFFSHSHSGRSCSSSIIGLDLFVLFEIKILILLLRLNYPILQYSRSPLLTSVYHYEYPHHKLGSLLVLYAFVLFVPWLVQFQTLPHIHD